MWWLLAVLLLFSGCTTFFQNAVKDAATQYKDKVITSVGKYKSDLGDWDQMQETINESQQGKSIYAFVCNSTKIPKWKRYWYYLISLGDREYLFDPPLLGAQCWLQDVGELPSWRAIHLMANLTKDEIINNPLFWDIEKKELIPPLKGNPKWYERIYTFGLASGPTFADFNNLNPYCNTSLRYSIKFIQGTKERYILPVAPEKRAACYLDLSVIPTYVFHGDNGFPKIDNSWELASVLYNREWATYEGTGVGPVVLITESSLTKDTFFDYTYYPDGSKTSDRNVELAFRQAKTLKSECPTCLVGLYIPLGINQSNINEATGDDDNKEDLAWIYEQFQTDSGLNESVDIIAFGLDVNELDDPCSWEEMVRRMNNMIEFARSLGKMSYVIYLNFPLNDSCRVNNKTYPLGYGSAADFLYWSLFRIDPAGNQQYKSWVGKGLMAISLPPMYPLSGARAFGACENCSLIIQDRGTWLPNQPVFSYVLDFCQNYSVVGYTYPIVFSSQDTLFNMGAQAQDSFYYSNVSDKTTIISPGKYYDLGEKDDVLFMCTGCFLQLSNKEITQYKTIFDLAEYEGDCKNPKDLIDELRVYAEILDVDLPYLRALIDSTSQFDKCYVSLVPKFRQEEKCGYDLTWAELESYASGCSWDDLKEYQYKWDEDECAEDGTGEDCVPCGLGILDVKGLKPDTKGQCGLYDPFDPNSNLCEGMYKVGDALEKARTKLSEKIGVFFVGIDDEGGLTEEQNTEYTILWMMLGAIYYNGEGAALDKAIEWYEISQRYDSADFDDGLCSSLDPDMQDICCPENPYGICGRGVKFWDFLKGLKQVAEDTDNRDVFETYKRTEFGLVVMSKYFDAYRKCWDCYNEVWGENIDKKLCRLNPKFCK